MDDLLTSKPDWHKLSAQFDHYTNTFSVSEFSRLCALFNPDDVSNVDDYSVSVQLELTPVTYSSSHLLKLMCACKLPLLCEICGRSSIQSLSGDNAMVIVCEGDADALFPSELEKINRDEVESIHQIIEDELLLSLPTIIRCNETGCKPDSVQFGESTAIEAEPENPFATLAEKFKGNELKY